uniref:Integron gene cassette protein n=1 Tax=Macrostomum lignano TaxID=282301 RepID=A0A1I8H3A5_9PLAT
NPERTKRRSSTGDSNFASQIESNLSRNSAPVPLRLSQTTDACSGGSSSHTKGDSAMKGISGATLLAGGVALCVALCLAGQACAQAGNVKRALARLSKRFGGGGGGGGSAMKNVSPRLRDRGAGKGRRGRLDWLRLQQLAALKQSGHPASGRHHRRLNRVP